MLELDRRTLLQGALALGAATLVSPRRARADAPPEYAQVEKRHDEAVQRLQEWVRQPSISAEGAGVRECCEMTMRFLKEAGFGKVERVATDGHPGIFAVFDAGTPR